VRRENVVERYLPEPKKKSIDKVEVRKKPTLGKKDRKGETVSHPSFCPLKGDSCFNGKQEDRERSFGGDP